MKTETRNFKHSSLRIEHFRPDGLPPEFYDRLRLISHVETLPDQRNKGHATRMLKRIMQEADQQGVTLVLEPKAEGDEPMDRNALESFYTRLGFERFQDNPCLMMRSPRQ